MTLGLMDPATRARFDRFCALVAQETEGPGITTTEIGDCGALARELEEESPDPERLEMLAGRLGLELDELNTGGST